MQTFDRTRRVSGSAERVARNNQSSMLLGFNHLVHNPNQGASMHPQSLRSVTTRYRSCLSLLCGIGMILTNSVASPSTALSSPQEIEVNSIKVVVRDAEGQPMEDIRVLQFDAMKFWAGQDMRFDPVAKRTDPDGSVSFDLIPDHQFRIEVSAGIGFRKSPNHADIRNGVVRQRDPLVQYRVVDGVLLIEFSIHTPADLNFHITDKQSKEVVDFASVYFRDDRTKTWTTLSFFDAEGQNNFTTIIESMVDADYIAARQGYFPKEFRLDVPLVAGESSTQNVELEPAPNIVFTVVDSGGNPVEGVKPQYIPVEHLDRGSYRPSRATDENGITTIKYPSQGVRVRYKFEHEKGAAEYAIKDLPMEVFTEEGDESVPVYRVRITLENE